MNPLSEFRSLFANSKKETSTKREKYKREEVLICVIRLYV